MSTETDDSKKSVFKALKRMENLQLSKDDLLGMQKHLEEMTVNYNRGTLSNRSGTLSNRSGCILIRISILLCVLAIFDSLSFFLGKPFMALLSKVGVYLVGSRAIFLS